MRTICKFTGLELTLAPAFHGLIMADMHPILRTNVLVREELEGRAHKLKQEERNLLFVAALLDTSLVEFDEAYIIPLASYSSIAIAQLPTLTQLRDSILQWKQEACWDAYVEQFPRLSLMNDPNLGNNVASILPWLKQCYRVRNEIHGLNVTRDAHNSEMQNFYQHLASGGGKSGSLCRKLASLTLKTLNLDALEVIKLPSGKEVNAVRLLGGFLSTALTHNSVGLMDCEVLETMVTTLVVAANVDEDTTVLTYAIRHLRQLQATKRRIDNAMLFTISTEKNIARPKFTLNSLFDDTSPVAMVGDAEGAGNKASHTPNTDSLLNPASLFDTHIDAATGHTTTPPKPLTAQELARARLQMLLAKSKDKSGRREGN